MKRYSCLLSQAGLLCLFLWAIAWVSLFASPAPLQLLSVRDASVSLPVAGNGDSVAPWVSADGRFVLFTSSANDLVPGDNGQLGLDVFLHDRASNTTVLVSANFSGTGGGNGSSMFAQVSTNGRYAVFQSDANDLLPGDTNGVSDIFVRDLQSETNILVSVTAGGGWANDASTDPIMTPDGRYVVFVSAATNLFANDTNRLVDIFVRDMVSNTTAVVTAGAAPPARNFSFPGIGPLMPPEAPVITPDGRYVAFFSTNNFSTGVPFTGAPYSSVGEVYVRDLVAGTVAWASSNAFSLVYSNMSGNKFLVSYHPTISADGRYVSFKTSFADHAGITAIFKMDFATGALTTLISTNGIPQGNGVRQAVLDDLFGPEMTPDGRFIVFVETNKAPINSTSVQLWDSQTATNILVSVAQDGSVPTNSLSDTPVLSPDGRFVAFMSNATNLTGSAVSNGFHIYLRDMQTGLTQLVDADTNGIGSTDSVGTIPSLSSDGNFVAFSSLDGNLVGADNNRSLDVFVRDMTGGTNELLSLRDPTINPQTGNSTSSLGQFSLSDNGRWVAFASYADDLVANDTNSAPDVFLGDLVAGTNVLVSSGTSGNPVMGGFSANPVISGNGRFVAFISTATNLVNGQTNLFNNIFLRDLQAGTNALVSVSTNGVSPGDNDSSAPVLSQDGRYIAFLSKARNLAPGLTGSGPNTFWRDMNSGATVSLAGTSSSSNFPTMSADGRYVAYFRQASQLWVWDSQAAANIYTNTSVVTSAALSPTGTQLVYQVAKKIFVNDLASHSNIFSIVSAPLLSSCGQWSSNGRYLTFVTATNAAFGDANGTNDIYLCDLFTGTLTLVSLNNSQTGSANGPSDSPAMSGDGRFVVYRSSATDIVAGITNPPPNIFLYDRLTGSNSLISVASSRTTNWISWASRPAINNDGRTVAFGSWASGLVLNDLNRVQDVFAESLTPWVATDSDGDGIPDWWLTQYFGHSTGQEADKSRAQDDADNDSLTNLQEYLTGTHPTDAASVFRLQIARMISTNTAALTWSSVPGGSYQIQYKDNLTDLVWLNLPGNPTVTGNKGYFIVPANQTNRFYRIIEGN